MSKWEGDRYDYSAEMSKWEGDRFEDSAGKSRWEGDNRGEVFTSSED